MARPDAQAGGQYAALMSQGTKYAKINASDKALATFSEAIRLNPRAAGAFYERGKAYQDKSDYDRAITDYNEAIRTRSKERKRL